MRGQQGFTLSELMIAMLLGIFVVGAVIGILLLSIQGKDKATPIPFGPYIAAAGWIAILWGEQLTGAYLSYLGL